MPATVRGPRIIVALDYATAAEALALAQRLDPARCRVKVGKSRESGLVPAARAPKRAPSGKVPSQSSNVDSLVFPQLIGYGGVIQNCRNDWFPQTLCVLILVLDVR